MESRSSFQGENRNIKWSSSIFISPNWALRSSINSFPLKHWVKIYKFSSDIFVFPTGVLCLKSYHTLHTRTSFILQLIWQLLIGYWLEEYVVFKKSYAISCTTLRIFRIVSTYTFSLWKNVFIIIAFRLSNTCWPNLTHFQSFAPLSNHVLVFICRSDMRRTTAPQSSLLINRLVFLCKCKEMP